jgi:hypothetical protein
MTAKGAVESGGVSLGALDVTRDRFVAIANYSEYQSRGRDIRMGVVFALNRLSRIRIVLSNWHPLNDSSTWTVANLGIAAVDARGTPGQGAIRRLIESSAARPEPHPG